MIFDEAHEIEDVAGQYFGLSIGNLQIHELIKDTAAVSRRKLRHSRARSRPHPARRSLRRFLSIFPHEGRQGFRQHRFFLHANEATYRELLLALKNLSRARLVQGAVEDTLPLVRRSKLVQQGLRYWLETPDPANVYWVETRGRGVYLQATPIDVSQTLSSRLFDRVDTVI